MHHQNGGDQQPQCGEELPERALDAWSLVAGDDLSPSTAGIGHADLGKAGQTSKFNGLALPCRLGNANP